MDVFLRNLTGCTHLSTEHIMCYVKTSAGSRSHVCFSHRFPDNFEKLSPPILQLDEVEFGYTDDLRLFTQLSVSADLESRICMVRVFDSRSHVRSCHRSVPSSANN